MSTTICERGTFCARIALLRDQLRAHYQRHWLKWVTVITAALLFQHFYMIGINISPSLPQRVFLIEKGSFTPQKGDYAAFRWHGQGGFYVGQPYFTKMVKGVGGDVVTVQGQEVFVNGEFVALAKQHSSAGKRMDVVAPKVIAEDEFFALASNPNSLDSRYAVVGYIKTSDIIGRAYPLF